MPYYVNYGGSWRAINATWVNVNGSWRACQQGWVNQSGTWRPFMEPPHGSASFYTVGTFSWQCPAGVRNATLTGIGGGAGGGVSRGDGNCKNQMGASGGGSSGVIYNGLGISVTGGATYTVYVGGGGNGGGTGPSPNNGGSGGGTGVAGVAVAGGGVGGGGGPMCSYFGDGVFYNGGSTPGANPGNRGGKWYGGNGGGGFNGYGAGGAGSAVTSGGQRNGNGGAQGYLVINW